MPKTPIMPPDQEKFMVFEGLVQWTLVVIMQSKRVATAKARLGSNEMSDSVARHVVILESHCEDHFSSSRRINSSNIETGVKPLASFQTSILAKLMHSRRKT
jgi:hypothetical protein